MEVSLESIPSRTMCWGVPPVGITTYPSTQGHQPFREALQRSDPGQPLDAPLHEIILLVVSDHASIAPGLRCL